MTDTNATVPGQQPTSVENKPGHSHPMTPRSEYFAIATQIFTIPAGMMREVDAIISWPGIELDRAVRLGAKYWNEGVGKDFLIAGYHDPEEAKRLFDSKNLQANYNLSHMNGVHTQVHADHAGMQADWCANGITALGAKSILLCVPRFHLPRAYLGILEFLRRRDIHDVLILPAWPAMSPFEQSMLNIPLKERTLCEMDVVHGEVDKRMVVYQQQKVDGSDGDNLTTARFFEYLKDVVYKHPLVTSCLMDR